MGKCCFCGKSVRASNEFTRRLNGRSCIACEDCAKNFDGIISDDESRRVAAQKWIEQVKSCNLINHEIANDLVSYADYINGNMNGSEKQTVQDESSSVRKINNSVISDNFYSQEKNSFVWINVIKIIAVINIIVCFAAGIAVGYMVFNDFGGAILGFIVGLLLGIVSVSVLMVFAEMAEDIKKIADKL